MRRLVKAIRRVYRGGEKGFTLIELLVVIGILAALAGVVTLGVTQFIGQGREEACKTDLHNVQTAVAASMALSPTAAIPANVAALVADGYLLTDPLWTYAIDQSTGVVAQDAGCW